MTKKHSTKKALVASILTLALCFSMLVGTTFAWFTDSVTSANNVITSGNLDITLEYYNGTEWKDVDGASDILAGDLWEPGYVDVAYLRIKNAGSLALKYQLGVNIVSETSGTNVNNESFKLSDYIYFDVKEGVDGKTAPYADRDAAMAIATETTKISAGYAKAGTLAAKSEYVYLAMVVYMPTSVGNDACHNGTDKPEIKLGVNIVATQLDSEADSFGPDYDEGLIPGYANVGDQAGLLNAMKNGENVALTADIDMTGWTTLASYSGTFNGNGHKIYNLSGENGLVEELRGATVKDLTIEGNVAGTSLWTGLLAGRTVKGTDNYITNVTVSGTVKSNSYYAGGLIGADSSASTVITGCTNNATITSDTLFVGGILGYTKRTAVVENCTNNGNVSGAGFVGGIVGFAACNDALEDAGENDPSLYLTVKGCVNTGTITANGPIYPESAGAILGAAGREGAKTPTQLCKTYITDCSVLGGAKVYGMLVNMCGVSPDGNVEVVVNGTNTLVTDTASAQAAIDAATPGTVIVLGAGTYGTLTVKNFWGGNYTMTGVEPITIKGGEGVTVGAIDLNGMNFVNIEGINFDASGAIQVYNNNGATGDYGNIVDSANEATKAHGANHITVKNCTFTGTAAVATANYCPINFMGSNPSSWTYNITVYGCKFLTNAQNYIRMNNITNNGNAVIENNVFGGDEFRTNHHAINASANGGDWVIKGNTFVNWNTQKCAFATSRSTAAGTTDIVITGNVFKNTKVPTAADGDDGVIEIKTNTYTTSNCTLVFEGNTFEGALAGLDETTIKYVKP